MEEESFIGAFGDVPTDLAGDYSQLYIFRAEDFGAWYRRVRDAHEREVDGGVAGMTDAQLADHGLVRLPVSEDGDVLHIGELVDEKLPFGGYAAPAPIDTMELSRGAGGYRWMVKLDAENRALVSPELLRHHHESTVETTVGTTLQKLLEQAVGYSDAHTTVALNAIAEFAAKLRLAGENA